MALTINTNVASLVAQRNLTSSQNDLATSLQRLSSGLRINSAKDDAAGLSISERFTAQIRGLDQGVRNANDGISLAQTAEGALAEVTANLQRIRELAVQSSNATNTAADRTSLQNEVTALVNEIDRVASQTKFNGTALLDGTFTGAIFQVGANAGETISITSITDANKATLGTVTTLNDADATINTASTLSSFASAVTAGDITINGVSIGGLAAAASKAARIGDIVEAINNVSQQTGVGASYDATNGQITLNSDAAVTIAGAGATAAEFGFTAGAAITTTTTTTGISNLTVANYAGAQTAITLVDDALSTINSARASLGAVQSRFESVVASQSVTSENLQASRSRILDADFAQETASLTKNQILQQSGIAMLAQANALPQNVLALLQ